MSELELRIETLKTEIEEFQETNKEQSEQLESYEKKLIALKLKQLSEAGLKSPEHLTL